MQRHERQVEENGMAIDKYLILIHWIEKIRNNLKKSVENVTGLMMDSINNNVAIVFQNQKLIEAVSYTLDSQ